MRNTGVVVVLGTVWAAGAAIAKPADDKPPPPKPATCTLVGTGHEVRVRLGRRPDAPISVSLDSDDGHSIKLQWDGSVDQPLARVVTLPVAGDWHVSATGERFSVLTQDGRGVSTLAYGVGWDCGGGDATGTVSLMFFSVSADTATWKPVSTGQQDFTIAVQRASDDKVASLVPSPALDFAADLGAGPRGLDSPVPTAVQDTLALLAEIAVSRAKAEGLRLFKEKLLGRVCGELTIKRVFGGDDPSLLLPSTCGQLDNLRLGDLGASAQGWLDALRADVTDVVLPHVIDVLVASSSTLTRLWALGKDEHFAQVSGVVLRLADHAIRRGLRVDDVRAAVLELVHGLDPAEATWWQAGIIAAVKCASQGCSMQDLAALLTPPDGELLAAHPELLTAIPGLRDAYLAERSAHPELLAEAQRVLALLQPRPDADPRQQAAELAELILDVVRTQGCDGDSTCAAAINAVRDIVVGMIESDYTRALGGVQAVMKIANLPGGLTGKPFELVAAIGSYVETYRETESKDPKEAHELRKEALESLIDSATDRTGRNGDWIISFAASVGFTGGWQIFPRGFADRVSVEKLHDLRLPTGFTLQHVPVGTDVSAWYFHASIADLAQFASSDAGNKQASPVTWSDFVTFGAQVGVRFGGADSRIPFVVGLDAGWAPRLAFHDAAGDEIRGVVRLGLFAGFNVPLFDLD